MECGFRREEKPVLTMEHYCKMEERIKELEKQIKELEKQIDSPAELPVNDFHIDLKVNAYTVTRKAGAEYE